MPLKVLLDTDIGSDVDDAVALAYLLAQPECDLLGITTVTGQPRQRASLASVLCHAAGRADIPIYPGAASPLIGDQRQPVAQQAAVLPRWPHQSEFPEDQAVDFLRRSIRANPGLVTLLTIGPLTNVARLFQADPETAGLLKGLVMMGGCFRTGSPEHAGGEWNIAVDPMASDVVYRTPMRMHRSLGIDVTRQVVMGAAAVREQFSTPLLRPVMDMAEIWFDQAGPAVIFHDPLAAAVVFDDTLVDWARGQVSVDIREAPGRTDWQPSDHNTPHEVALRVDVQRYFGHFSTTLGLRPRPQTLKSRIRRVVSRWLGR